MQDKAKRLITPSLRSNVPPFMVMDVMAAAARIEAQGGHVIHMEVGQPAAAAPTTAIAAARAALLSGRLGYTETLGTTPLRARIAQHYRESYGLEIDPQRVAVTTGSSAAFILAFLALFETGDRVAVALPGYPPYRHILRALGCVPVTIETIQATRWAITPEMLLAEHRKAPLKGVLIASPANPTGTMVSASLLRDLIATAEGEGISFISDEIYHGLDYAFAAETAVKLSDSAVVINSFSKFFCMTGWRIGWMVLPPDLVRSIDRLQGNLAISAPALSQIAALAAFEGRAEMEAVKHGYEENRRLLLANLPGIGFEEILPVDGAFYLYAGVSRFCSDSYEFAKQMLAKTHVAITPGADFDPLNGRRFIRMSYSGSREEMQEAIERLRNWLT
jgi:aspartate/methionine/tyrosine aminotransferase